MNTLISILTGAVVVAVSVVCLAGLASVQQNTARDIQTIIVSLHGGH